jgi:putative transposase
LDGLPGLEKVFEEEFKGAVVQRCQIHVARNVMSKVPHKLREKVADEVRSIFLGFIGQEGTRVLHQV